MSVEGRLKALGDFVRNKRPFERIEGQVFLDAQATIQWTRLGVLERVLLLLPEHEEPRFRIQSRAFGETAGVVANQYSDLTFGDTTRYLKKLPNLMVGDPIPSTTTLGERTLDLQARCFIEAGEDPKDHSPSRHLGEAETLAVMEMFAPDALFVTGDIGAIALARSIGVGVPVSPLAFVGGVIRAAADVQEFWQFTCFGRECVFAGESNPSCVEALECHDLTAEAAERSPIHRRLLRAEDALEWMCQDLQKIDSLLAG